MKRLLFLSPVIILAIALVALALGLKRDPSKIPSTLIDRPLPEFALPGVYEGSPGFGSADLTGEPRLMNIFASWCTACRIEHPMLMQLRGQGVPIYGLDWKDKPADGARWLRTNGDPYLAAANDENGRVGIDLGVTGVPETFVIDRAGRVRYKHIGPISPDDWRDTLQPLFQKLRSE
jgi:cytochrome c biogenesis protein CcmG/thiol:disulfide interchange protein DsbE